MGHRPTLHPLFKGARHEISEFTFANIYLFRETHNYRISMLSDGLLVITGNDNGSPFFMLPFGLPDKDTLGSLFKDHISMKAVSEGQALILKEAGYEVTGDTDNFDYLYNRDELARLSGRKFHRKKNLVNAFIGNYRYEAEPLLEEYMGDAVFINEEWRKEHGEAGDFKAAKDALLNCYELQLCGYIYYVEGSPAAFTLGEELKPDTFVVHFEKGRGAFKGLLQFVNQSFSSLLPEKYTTVNMEQDLGDEGLRQSKLSYRPSGFVKKYRASVKGE
ncbi:MAG: DUF2156 domain-containing protein [Deltaproteobacteria bacterium]|nr:DUF2156 domain-containing protein [Deltaproteobacteria bacterium]